MPQAGEEEVRVAFKHRIKALHLGATLLWQAPHTGSGSSPSMHSGSCMQGACTTPASRGVERSSASAASAAAGCKAGVPGMGHEAAPWPAAGASLPCISIQLQCRSALSGCSCGSSPCSGVDIAVHVRCGMLEPPSTSASTPTFHAAQMNVMVTGSCLHAHAHALLQTCRGLLAGAMEAGHSVMCLLVDQMVAPSKADACTTTSSSHGNGHAHPHVSSWSVVCAAYPYLDSDLRQPGALCELRVAILEAVQLYCS